MHEYTDNGLHCEVTVVLTSPARVIHSVDLLDPALAPQNIGSWIISIVMATRSILSLSGYMGRTNTVILSHMAGAKKNVVYFPGDTQVSITSCIELINAV